VAWKEVANKEEARTERVHAKNVQGSKQASEQASQHPRRACLLRTVHISVLPQSEARPAIPTNGQSLYRDNNNSAFSTLDCSTVVVVTARRIKEDKCNFLTF
jgi:hypothetical protein